MAQPRTHDPGRPYLSVVSPCYNEQKVLDELHRRGSAIETGIEKAAENQRKHGDAECGDAHQPGARVCGAGDQSGIVELV